jgi:chromosome partitioning protein
MSVTTIVIANQKGGVGKTTTAVSLSTGLADLGYPTILIDCDPQGNIASFLGLEPGPGLYELVVEHRRPTEVVRLMTGLGYPKLGLIPGDTATVDLETLLRTSPRFQPAQAFREALRPFQTNGRNGKTTVIVLDTAPSLSSVQVAALSVADWLLIPTSPEYASETGIGALVKAVTELQQAGANLNLLGVLPTMVDTRSREHHQTITELEAAFPGLVLPPVRRLIALAEAPREGKPIWSYAPKSEAALDYAAVLKEVISRAGL